ncbi:MAG: TorF family putative porin [Caulobacteraceae bacterium]
MKTITMTATMLALSAGGALADPMSQAPKPIGPCAGVYASVAGLSDYRFDGFSESNRAPTWQVTAYCYRNDGFFVGTTLTGVDFEDAPRTHFEADWYVGRQVQWRGAKVTAELLYASFPDKRAPGPSYDIVEPQLEVSRAFSRLTLGALASWETTTSGGANEWHARASAAYAVTPWLSLSGHAGRFFAARGADHDYDAWDVGATAAWRRFSLDARYAGTDRPVSQCFFTNWCQAGPAVSLSYRLLP